PWNERLEFPRSIYRGTKAGEVRVWGRRRLAILARALPMARSLRLHLTGTGLPSFFVVDFGGLRFTLGLSGWTANDWSSAGQFDLLAPRHAVDSDSAAAVFDALSKSWFASAADLSRQTQIAQPLVHAAMTLYCQAGRAIFDLDNARNEQPVLRLDADDRLVEARCTCGFYVHNKMTRGPCEHMLAVRRIFHAQVEGIAQGSGGAA